MKHLLSADIDQRKNLIKMSKNIIIISYFFIFNTRFPIFKAFNSTIESKQHKLKRQLKQLLLLWHLI